MVSAQDLNIWHKHSCNSYRKPFHFTLLSVIRAFWDPKIKKERKKKKKKSMSERERERTSEKEKKKKRKKRCCAFLEAKPMVTLEMHRRS